MSRSLAIWSRAVSALARASRATSPRGISPARGFSSIDAGRSASGSIADLRQQPQPARTGAGEHQLRPHQRRILAARSSRQFAPQRLPARTIRARQSGEQRRLSRCVMLCQGSRCASAPLRSGDRRPLLAMGLASAQRQKQDVMSVATPPQSRDSPAGRICPDLQDGHTRNVMVAKDT